jgi:hypothetical protein
MRRIMLLTAALSFPLIHYGISRAQEGPSLPTCAVNGDKDGDGVVDWDDSDEADSCLVSSVGLEDCNTGAGDGLPDCE